MLWQKNGEFLNGIWQIFEFVDPATLLPTSTKSKKEEEAKTKSGLKTDSLRHLREIKVKVRDRRARARTAGRGPGPPGAGRDRRADWDQYARAGTTRRGPGPPGTTDQDQH